MLPSARADARTVFDPMLQLERTALAWERTAVAMMVAGILLTRHSTNTLAAMAVTGITQVVLGAGLLVWAGMRYEQLHTPLRRGENPAHPRAVHFVGQATTGFTAIATLIAIAVTLG